MLKCFKYLNYLIKLIKFLKTNLNDIISLKIKIYIY